MIYTLIKRDSEGNFESIFSFDVIDSYSESWSASVSKSTVENGFPISDHINTENPTFDINGALSTYSINNPNNEITWDGEDFVLVGDLGTTTIGHLVARENLKQIFLQKSVLTLLETEFNSFNYESNEDRYEELTQGYTNEYNNCVITGLTFSYPERSKGVVLVSMKVEQLNIARVETTMLSEQEMQPRLTPLKKESQGVGKSDASEGDKGSSAAVAEKPADVGAPAKKGEAPIELRKELADERAANEAYSNAIGGYANGTIAEGKDFVRINNHGSVYSVDVARRQ
jgi:hypothetical protein